jgi:2-polyprenyl-6-methoxyphenol hydroxylase-like FAD-dependent oxidoreductase
MSRDIPFSLLLEPIRFKDNEFRADLPPNYIYWVLQGRKDHYDLDDPELLSLSPIECAKMTQDLTSHWHPSLHPLFEEQVIGQTSILRIESSLPEIRSLDEKERGMVTLIGDSIHAMSPTAVVGAVTALRDAADLAQVLAEDGLKVESLGKYEGAMREYAGEAIRNSARGGMMLFGMRPFEELKLAV